MRSLIDPSGLEQLRATATLAPAGAIVEIGVYQGGSASVLYQVARAQGRELFLYDTFAGHPFHDDGIDDHPLGRFADAIDPNRLRELLPHAHVIVGTFPESLVEMPPVAFVHADADIYQSTLAICRDMPPRMVDLGVLYFDDYSHGDCRGCKRAVDEIFGSLVSVLPGGQAKVVTGTVQRLYCDVRAIKASAT